MTMTWIINELSRVRGFKQVSACFAAIVAALFLTNLTASAHELSQRMRIPVGEYWIAGSGGAETAGRESPTQEAIAEMPEAEADHTPRHPVDRVHRTRHHWHHHFL